MFIYSWDCFFKLPISFQVPDLIYKPFESCEIIDFPGWKAPRLFTIFMSSDLLFMLFLIPMQKKKSLWAALENSTVGTEKGVGGQQGKIVKLAWQCVDPGSFQMMGMLPDRDCC